MKRNRPKEQPALPLNPELEASALHACLRGELPLDRINPTSLSKHGLAVYKTIKAFDGGKASAKAVFLHATEVLGVEPDEFKKYLAGIKESDTGHVAEILDSLYRKTIIEELVNEASSQVSSGQFSLLSMKQLLDRHINQKNTLRPLLEDMDDVSPPKGIQIPSLPSLNEHCGGIYGCVAISGEPAAGKSTLGLQISLSSARSLPVLYYDFEQGKQVIRWHVHKALQGNKARIVEATKQLYVRHSIHSLERDLAMVQEPALVVVDSIQKVAAGLAYRRESLEDHVHKLEALKKDGHTVILISEKNRAHYGDASMTGFKETGEIEYAADLCLDLILPNEQDSSRVDVHVTKNRHFPFKGKLTTLERVNSWWFMDPLSKRRRID